MYSALPLHRLRPVSWREHQDPASNMEWKKSKKKNKQKQKQNKNKQNKTKKELKQTDKTPRQMVKPKLNRRYHMKKYAHMHSQKEKKKRENKEEESNQTNKEIQK